MPENSTTPPGLTREFIDDLQARLSERVLTGALDYFREGSTAYGSDSGLKRVEMAQQFFDYQPCCASVLARLAAKGDERAMTTVRRIFDNEQYFLDEWRSREGYRFCLRRVQLHLALAYELLHESVEPDTSVRWRALLLRSAEDILQHFNRFEERVPALDNRAFGTGINHVALSAESVWRTGAVLGRDDLCQTAGAFIDRLVEYGHPDGYFEEHTNDAREGGPSLLYTGLTAGAAFTVSKWRGTLDRERFAKCGAFYRSLVDAGGNCLAFADERANASHPSCFGLAIHSLTSEGRAFLRRILAPDSPLVSGANLHNSARIALELDNCETGDGAVPEYLREGDYRLTLPLGVRRRNAWTAGLSALKALNREIAPGGDYALDRQSVIFLSHRTVGVILRGGKSKRDPSWSTLRSGDDAWPTRTGELGIESDALSAVIPYGSFTATVTWELGEEARLSVSADGDDVALQLVPEMRTGETVFLDGEPVVLGEEKRARDAVRRLGTTGWEIESPVPGRFEWYIAPFNPYSEGNLSAPETRRPIFSVPVAGGVALSLHTRP